MTTDKTPLMTTDWPEASQFRRSIRLEFALYVSGIILVLMAITGYVISDQYVKTVTRNVVDKILVQARSHSGTAGKLLIADARPDALLLSNICNRLAGDNPDVYWVGITDVDDVFIAHTDLKQVIGSARMRKITPSGFHDLLAPHESFAVETDTVYITVPVEENQVVLGKLAVAASAGSIKEARKTSILTVGMITVAMIMVGIPVTVAVLRQKLRPISVITEHLKSVDLRNISLEVPVTTKNELGFLAATIRVMGAKLNVAQKELIEKERMSRELEIARQIQANILPKTYPQGQNIGLAGAYLSAREVGGDYYDFIDFDDEHIGILIADVSGKSLPGMLVMLMTRDIVKRVTRSVREPHRVLCEVNRELLGNIKRGMFVTMFFGVLNKANGELSFASAGHNPIVLVSGGSGRIDLIKTKGLPLGLVGSEAYERRVESGEIRLSPDDWVILYTDGVTEAQNGTGEEFGLDRFSQIISAYRSLSPEEFVTRLLKKHRQFVGKAPQYDDITVLAVKWLATRADTQREAVEEIADGCQI